MAAVTIWGASFAIIQAGIGKLPVNLFLFFRFGTGAILILGVTGFRGFRREVWRRPGAWILGGLLYLSFVTQTAGLVLTSPARSAFLTSLSALIVPVLLAIVTKRVPALRVWLAVGVFLAGLFILFYRALGSTSEGDYLSALCAFFFSAYLLLAERLVREQDVVNVTAVQTCAVALVSGLVTLFQGNAHAVSLPRAGIIAILYSGILATVLAFGAQLFAQTRIDATSTALILCAEPVVAAILSVIVGRDQAQWPLLVGGSLMFAGAAFGQMSPAPGSG